MRTQNNKHTPQTKHTQKDAHTPENKYTQKDAYPPENKHTQNNKYTPENKHAPNNRRRLSSLHVLTAAAMLTAVSVVIGIVCKNLFTFSVYYRVTFENLPVILSGLLFGPVTGAAVAVCADALSCLLSANPAINPIVSLGALFVGALSGAAPYAIKKRGAAQTALAVGSAHLVGQVAIKSVGKVVYYGMPWYGVFVGLGISAGVGVFEFAFINWLLSTRILSRYWGRYWGGKPHGLQ